MLNCEECATEPATVEEALRWRAYLISVVDDGDDKVILVCLAATDQSAEPLSSPKREASSSVLLTEGI